MNAWRAPTNVVKFVRIPLGHTIAAAMQDTGSAEISWTVMVRIIILTVV